MIKFRDIAVAPLPVKERKVRQPRQPKYPMDDIAVGGARVFPAGEKPISTRNSVYQAARKHAEKNADFAFKVVLDSAAGEVWVHRLEVAKENTDAASQEGWGGLGEPASETVTNGDYRGFAGMTADEMGDNSLAAAE